MMRSLRPGSVRWLRAGSALLLALACATVFIVGTPTQVNAADVAITIDKFAFMPGTMTVPVGTRVVWTNLETAAPHDVTSDTGVFASGNLTTGQTFSYTFMQPGTYAYTCTIHPRMKATITVVAATGGGQTNAVAAATTAPGGGVAAPPTRAAAPIPAGMPRTGGGAMATRFVGDDSRSSLPLVLMTGMLALVLAGAAVYVRSRSARV